jgi:hypothetical protein
MLVETINAIGSTVTGAIRQAAEMTGAGFSYLLATAKIESGLNPTVKASTSSATGLFQFIDQTWLMTMKQSGAEFGLGRYADAIEKTASGRYVVQDTAMRAEILNLRKNPSINAQMAGALTRHNAARLKTRIGRDATDGELYMAHFLGAGGAARLINAAGNNPQAKAATLFPRAAAANPSIFYDKQGAARSVTAVYGLLASKLARAMPGDAQVAASSPAVSSPAAASPAASRTVATTTPANGGYGLFAPTHTAAVSPSIPMPPLSESVAPLMFAQTRGPSIAPNAGTAPIAPSGPPLAFASDGSGFHSLFRTDGRGAVSNTVSELWGARPDNAVQTRTAVTPSAATSSTGDSGGFDLFRSSGPQS